MLALVCFSCTCLLITVYIYGYMCVCWHFLLNSLISRSCCFMCIWARHARAWDISCEVPLHCDQLCWGAAISHTQTKNYLWSSMVENKQKKSRSDLSCFLFCSAGFVFVGSCFCIYENGRGFSARFRRILFLSRIDLYLFRFHPIFNLCEICLEIDMFINLLITNYAC
jgi:hypothetical protein